MSKVVNQTHQFRHFPNICCRGSFNEYECRRTVTYWFIIFLFTQVYVYALVCKFIYIFSLGVLSGALLEYFLVLLNHVMWSVFFDLHYVHDENWILYGQREHTLTYTCIFFIELNGSCPNDGYYFSHVGVSSSPTTWYCVG